jgi:hypothetical protein
MNDNDTTIPPYCDCSADAWNAAKIEFAAMRLNPAWIAMAPLRRSALAAQMHSGMHITPSLAAEFEDILIALAYRPATPRPPAPTVVNEPPPGTLPPPPTPDLYERFPAHPRVFGGRLVT